MSHVTQGDEATETTAAATAATAESLLRRCVRLYPDDVDSLCHLGVLQLQGAAVCCNVLQCVAVCCSVMQCVAVCCGALQCVAVSTWIRFVT